MTINRLRLIFMAGVRLAFRRPDAGHKQRIYTLQSIGKLLPGLRRKGLAGIFSRDRIRRAIRQLLTRWSAVRLWARGRGSRRCTQPFLVRVRREKSDSSPTLLLPRRAAQAEGLNQEELLREGPDALRSQDAFLLRSAGDRLNRDGWWARRSATALRNSSFSINPENSLTEGSLSMNDRSALLICV